MTKQKSFELRKVSSGCQISIGKFLDKNCGLYFKTEKKPSGEIVLTPVRIVENTPLS